MQGCTIIKLRYVNKVKINSLHNQFCCLENVSQITQIKLSSWTPATHSCEVIADKNENEQRECCVQYIGTDTYTWCRCDLLTSLGKKLFQLCL